MSDHFGYIDNFTLETSCDDIDALSREVTALKLALGLFFRSIPDEHKLSHILTLESIDNEEMRSLASFLRQFMNIKKTPTAPSSIN
ncbi:hypothetical protein QZQ41_17050 [Serratia marcescens]|uniref:hypothetical protein n=1 Tax=Serratia TaxID=613 RepID=UPI002543DF9A|nr:MULTISPECIES: hypothetical protein [Serratia]MDP8656296.1 hypothetical protein [Serratia marcescens]MDP8661280.1 hypothetical protein [Serratia marcescens]MDP8720520.1 hypothetical protein [Serratia marcescens]WIJ63845.1 hypothetical protein OI978_24065 [Serratia nevei]